MTANDNGTLDRLRDDCRALAGALLACDPSHIAVHVYAGHVTAKSRDVAVGMGFGITTEAALADLRNRLTDACADRVTRLVAEARQHDAEAERCRRTADALSRVVSAAREGAPRG